MKLVKHFYKVGDTRYEDRVGISSLDRMDYMTPQYVDMFYDELSSIELVGNTALLYVGGVGLHNAENRKANEVFVSSTPVMGTGLAIKNLQAYMMHKYAGILSSKNNITYVNINSNTCASSLHAIYEAEGLILRGIVDNVIVIAEEKTSNDTVRIFHEHNIPLVVGEGFACAVFSKTGEGFEVTDTKWGYEYNRNPFLVTESGYRLVASECDVVKGHKTGTVVNDTAEEAVFGETIGYKDRIGHCQGASGLIELCMLVDDEEVSGKILGVASGLGGFYASYILHK